MISKLISKTLFISAFVGASALGTSAMAQSSQAKFQTLDPAVSTSSGDKVEVLEFFAYNCPHCNHVQPMVEEFQKNLPENVVFKPVPVAWSAGMEPMQRYYYTIVALGHPELHSKIFHAIHAEKKKLFTRDAFIDWAEEQGLDKKKVESTFDSFGVNTKVKQATELAKKYKIEGTPTFAIGGKYTTSPATAGSYKASVDLTKELAEKILKDKKGGDKSE